MTLPTTRHPAVLLRCMLFAVTCLLANPLLARPSVPSLIPQPAQFDAAEGNFSVGPAIPIVVADKTAASLRTAQWLAALTERTRGLKLAVHQRAAGAGAIVLQLDGSLAPGHDEAYVLDVTPQGIRLTARTDAGLFRGATTLWQLLTPDAKHGAVQVPAMHIADQPRFGWRGLMLDSVRHFQSVAEVKQLLDQMAQHKLNVFH